MTFGSLLSHSTSGSYKPDWKQSAYDQKGKKRFHGAFTGGFSAGYRNTVGSAEGWTPSSYSGIQNDISDANYMMQYNNLMDDEDLIDYESKGVDTLPKDFFDENMHIYQKLSFSNINAPYYNTPREFKATNVKPPVNFVKSFHLQDLFLQDIKYKTANRPLQIKQPIMNADFMENFVAEKRGYIYPKAVDSSLPRNRHTNWSPSPILMKRLKINCTKLYHKLDNVVGDTTYDLKEHNITQFEENNFKERPSYDIFSELFE